MINDFGFYFITDRKWTKKGILEDVKSAIKAGVKIIQYRDNNTSKSEFEKNALEIQKLCNENDIIFIINDNAELARKINANGVHLGQEDADIQKARVVLGEKIIGKSTHSYEQALSAKKEGVDYISVGPIFETKTKPELEPVGLELLEKVTKEIRIPVVAIGGINKKNLKSVLKTGVKNVAMLNAVLTKQDVTKEIKSVLRIVKNFKRE